MANILNAFRSRWIGIALAIATPLLVILCHCAAMAKYPAHLHEMVEELGSILVFAGRPLPNNACTQLVFIQYRTNDSWGIYLQDIAGGKRQLLDVLSTDTWREGVVYEQLRTLGWSTDDRYFAYCRDEHKTVVICETASGKRVAVFPVDKPITAGVWLSPRTLVCSDGEQLAEFTQSGTQWLGPRRFAAAQNLQKCGVSAEKPITVLQACSPTKLLWQHDGAIWRSDQETDVPVEIWRSPTNELVEFSYSREAERLLLHGRDGQGDYFADFFPQSSQHPGVITNMERIECPGYRPTQVRLINNGRGYAYLNESDFSLDTPVIKIDPNHAALRFPWRGEIKSFAVSGDQLFVISSMTNEPAGIWKYDLTSGAVNQIVSNQEHPFRYATSQPTLDGVVASASGKRLAYYLLQPPIIPPRRTIPLVIGIMGNKEKAYNWDRYAQTIANYGYYFVMVDRRNSDQSEWAGEALAVYEALIREYDIDTNNVCLFGISSGASSISDMLERDSQRWHGAIFCSPAALPRPSRLHVSKLLVDIGALDETWGEKNSRVKEFRDMAASFGTPVTLFIRPGVGHNCRLLSVERERLQQLAAFLCNP